MITSRPSPAALVATLGVVTAGSGGTGGTYTNVTLTGSITGCVALGTVVVNGDGTVHAAGFTVTTNPAVSSTGAAGCSPLDKLAPSGTAGVPANSAVQVATVGTWTYVTHTALLNLIAMTGGGGAGGGGDNSAATAGGGGGGAGATIASLPVAVTPGASLTLTVGAGAASVAAGSSGGAGGTTFFTGALGPVPFAGPGSGGTVGGATTGGTAGSGGAAGDAFTGGGGGAGAAGTGSSSALLAVFNASMLPGNGGGGGGGTTAGAGGVGRGYTAGSSGGTATGGGGGGGGSEFGAAASPKLVARRLLPRSLRGLAAQAQARWGQRSQRGRRRWHYHPRRTVSDCAFSLLYAWTKLGGN